MIEPINVDDLAALKALYLSTGGDRWTNNSNWNVTANPSTLTATDVDNWYGVTVDLTTGRVVALDLSGNNLTGTLPEELGNLASLQTLDLSRNEIGEQIPAELKNLGSLRSLRLDENHLRAPLPADLSAFLTGLENFDLENPPYVVREISDQTTLAGRNFTPLDVSTSFADLNDNITSYSASGLPPGLTLDANTGRIRGNPTAAGKFAVTVTAIDSPTEDLDEGASDEFVITVKQIINSTDLAALRALFRGTGGDNWVNTANWDVDADPRTLTAEMVNDWHGVTVDLDTGRVTHIELSGNSLTGTLPVELGNLSALQTLDLTLNQLSGKIPLSLGNLLQLENLSLGDNQLSGNIPANLGNLKPLESLKLNGNQLDGVIPESLGDLAQLKFLQLEENKLTGSIPETFTQLIELRVLSLSNNQLRGPIPPALADWLDGILNKNLENRPYLVEAIPDQQLAIGDDVLLDIKDIFDDIEGRGDIVEYEAVGLPPGLTINTRTGQVSGTPAAIGEFSVVVTARDDIEQEISNEFIITVKQFVHPDDLAVLKVLYDSTDGDRWTVNTNWDVNADPATIDVTKVNTWHGVTVDVLTGRVTALELSSNNLRGTIPAELGNLDALRMLLLDSNQLTGTIPPELGNLTPLTALLLSNNQLSGAVPAALTELQNLEQLGLANNQLTGVLSPAQRAWLDDIFTKNIENPPYVNRDIPDQETGEDKDFALSLAGVFSDIEGQGDIVSYAASGLPSGLMINPSTGEITGSPIVEGSDKVTVTVTVTATDNSGLSVSKEFALTITPADVLPEAPKRPVPTPFPDILDGEIGIDVIRALEGGDLVTGNGGDDRLHGNDGNDVLFGNQGSDRLWGGRNRDRLHGGIGRDIIRGNGGKDTLFGEDGNDTLIGGIGRDRLIGGGGSDVFVYRKRNDRRDIITDFQIGTDQLNLRRLIRSLNADAAEIMGDIVQLKDRGNRTLVRIDMDGLEGNKSAFTLVAVKGVNASELEADIVL